MDAQLDDDDYAPEKLAAWFNGVNGGAAVTHKYLAEMLDSFASGLTEALVESLRAATLKHDAEFAALRGEIAALKKAWPEYRGVWSAGTYEKNWTATHAGSLWIAKRTTAARPGDGADWQLCCKRGADGRDANK